MKLYVTCILKYVSRVSDKNKIIQIRECTQNITFSKCFLRFYCILKIFVKISTFRKYLQKYSTIICNSVVASIVTYDATGCIQYF